MSNEMADHAAHDDVQRDQRALAGLYAQRADVLARQRVADEELAQKMRELDRARAAARSTEMELEAADAAIAAQHALIQRRARILSPIHHLPSELLGKVFSETVNLRNEGRCEPSFTVASISRRWRSVALSGHALWASVHLDFIKRSAHATEYVQTILARSAGLPLRVHVCAPVEIAPETMAVLEESLPQVIMRADDLQINHRYLHEYDSRPAKLSDSVFKFLQLPTPHMHRLCIIAQPGQAADSLLPTAPVLRSLRLCGVTPRALLGDALLNLREITISIQALPDLASLSVVAPKLHRLTLSASLELFTLPAPTPTTFSRLEELHVGGLRILSCFTAESLPALRRITISPGLWFDGIVHPLPSMPVLRYLELRSSVPLNLASLVGGIPQLETLVLSGAPDQSDLWKTWLLPKNITAHPRLLSLVIEDEGLETEEVVKSFIRFLEARAAFRDGETLRSPFVPLELTLRKTAFRAGSSHDLKDLSLVSYMCRSNLLLRADVNSVISRVWQVHDY